MVRKPMAKWMKITLACWAMGVMCIGVLLEPAHAGDYSELDGKTIGVIISGAPGETSDTLARSFFKSLQAELPKVTTRIQNITGGTKALKELAGASEPGPT